MPSIHVKADGQARTGTIWRYIQSTKANKLSQTKSKYADDDAIIDDTAGQAYVEQFGLETFERADRAVQANKVTK